MLYVIQSDAAPCRVLVTCFAPLFTSQQRLTHHWTHAQGMWVCYCRLWGRRVGWAIVTRLMFVYYTGARIRLPIVSWERRFIDMAQSSDAGKGEAEVGSGDQSAGQQPEGDDYSESGGEGDGNGRGADGLYGVMLMSSTHHRFAGLFTIRRPGARPVTQLLVRGSPALCGARRSISVLQRVASSTYRWLWAACRLGLSSLTCGTNVV